MKQTSTVLGKLHTNVVANVRGFAKKKNYVALVSERTIQTERPPLLGEVSAKFCG
jgi:hypothetical protein